MCSPAGAPEQEIALPILQQEGQLGRGANRPPQLDQWGAVISLSRC